MREGVIECVTSIKEIDLIIIDYDNLNAGDKVEDLVIGNADREEEEIYSIFNNNDMLTQEIREHLKQLNF